MDIHGPPSKGTSNNVVTTTEIGSKRGLDVNIISGGSASATTLTTQVVAHTISSGQVGTWQTVPVSGLLNVFQVDVYDSTNTFPINIAYRITNSITLEILSQSAQTYTLRIIGAA